MNNNSNGSDANASTENQREAEDRLVDWGLQKNAATAEAAPDLTERILAAAATGDKSPNVETVLPPQRISVRHSLPWVAVAALAALLLVGFVTSSFTSSSFRRSASHDSRQIGLATLNKMQGSVDGKDVEGQMPELISQRTKEIGDAWQEGYSDKTLEDEILTWPDEVESPSFGFGVTLDSAADGARVRESSNSGLAAEGEVADNDKLMMMTTPRIIIQDEEENVGIGGGQGKSEDGRPSISVALDPVNRIPRVDLDVGLSAGSFAEATPALQQGYDMNSGYGQSGYGDEGGDSDWVRDIVASSGDKVSHFDTTDEAAQRGFSWSDIALVPDVSGGGRGDRIEQARVAFFANAQERRFLESKLQQFRQRRFEQEIPEQRGGDKYAPIHENAFIAAKGTAAVSTFSIDVDTASYTNMRQYLNNGQLPPPDSVRLEELVNYFKYDYAGPDQDDKHPFAAHTEVATCPWNESHRLVRVALKGREIKTDKRPLSNIVFLIDVSGSMNDSNKLPLVIDGLKQMTAELGEDDRVAIVVYAGSEGLALDSTCGEQKDQILAALGSLSAGGSTAGGAGIELAYKIAEKHFIKGGSNRVMLCTDGDFNVGVSDTASLERLAEAKAAETGVFLTVLGFGQGNLNDEMMEKISNCGNGNYYYIDNLREARRVLVGELSGTLVTIAKDVKIQVEFNPANVAGYRLLGYENRVLARKDFDDDTKDAGEVGAGHTVTALYEVVPVGAKAAKKPAKPQPEPLKYQPVKTVEAELEPVAEEDSVAANEGLTEFTDELLTLRLRYKLPDEDTSTKIEVAVKNDAAAFAKASGDFRFASSVAGFGMLLRGSRYCGDATFASVRDLAAESLGKDEDGRRTEFLELIDAARRLVE